MVQREVGIESVAGLFDKREVISLDFGMATKQITVNAEWDSEAQVWVATSDDVPGLVTEAGTVEALAEKLSVMIPELLEANGHLAGNELRQVPINLIAHREQIISLRG